MRLWFFGFTTLCLALLATAPGVAQTIPAPVYLPVIRVAPLATATPTLTVTATRAPATPTATVTITPSPTATSALLYICDHDAYNCSEFDTQPEAQVIFDYCFDRGAGDIHKLDQDGDGDACETLPPTWEIVTIH